MIDFLTLAINPANRRQHSPRWRKALPTLPKEPKRPAERHNLLSWRLEL